MPINSPRYRWSELDGEQRAELNQQIVDLTEAFLDDITHLQEHSPRSKTRAGAGMPPTSRPPRRSLLLPSQPPRPASTRAVGYAARYAIVTPGPRMAFCGCAWAALRGYPWLG